MQKQTPLTKTPRPNPTAVINRKTKGVRYSVVCARRDNRELYQIAYCLGVGMANGLWSRKVRLMGLLKCLKINCIRKYSKKIKQNLILIYVAAAILNRRPLIVKCQTVSSHRVLEHGHNFYVLP